ncbi:MAG: MBL fold metallo-hydrolase [Burkholderiales bacterium]|nr:MBL fold metallo-hydrolase [Burkholderiales bacterium]
MSTECAQPAGSTRLILLGTKGGLRVGGEGRANPSNLLVVNGVPYVVDCGYGVSRQLVRAGVPLNTLRYVFLTHHHSDHNLEYGPLLYNGWATGLKQQVDVYGPPPLAHITDAFLQSMKFDIDIRIADEGRSDLRELINTHEIDRAGPVCQNGDVTVSSLRVKHPPIENTYAYRFDTKDRSIVFSGDTAYFPELATFAKGADVLVHEVMYLPGLDALVKRVPNASTLREHLLASHTLTEDVGRIAQASGVETLVLSHLVPGDDPTITDEMWAEGVRKHFGGRIIVGSDLMEI